MWPMNVTSNKAVDFFYLEESGLIFLSADLFLSLWLLFFSDLVIHMDPIDIEIIIPYYF